MEAAPRLPLLQFPCKISTESADFSSTLRQHIQTHYREDPESYSKEIRELESLRSSACRVQKDFTGCSTLKKYYSQLELLKNRFPQTTISMLFAWKDIYSGSVDTLPGVQYEQSCILHNIGALHSELGAMDSRQTSEGMKVSCTHFQCSAWAFQHLRDNFPQPKGTDMSFDVLTFYSGVMLAHAQQCILEKSMLDNRKSTIIAKVSAQVVEYYKQSLKALDAGAKQAETSMIHSIVGSKLYKLWKKYLEFTIVYHSCITYLYMGNQAEELQKMGERVTYYQAALDKLNEAAKLAKNLDMEVTEAITFTMDVVGGKLNAASKENEFVYHEKVPVLESLPEIKGASLVKGIPFHPTDAEVSGPDIFARLVPMEAHEASSLYSEEKAKLWREAHATIDEKDQELTMFLSSLQLEHLKSTEPAHLPQQLVDCCAALSIKPNAVKDLMNAMQKLSGMFHDVESLLREISTQLEEEDEREKDYQKVMGKRAPNMITLEMKKELLKYQEAHKKASDSNLTLHKAMNLHIGNLNLLTGSLDELAKAIPSVNILDAPNDEGVVKELQRLLSKVDEMKSQRAMLSTQLRESLQADDITKQLVVKDDKTLEEVFAQELKKHDRQFSLINQNLVAQDNICRAITDANARYADIRKATYELMHRRKSMIDSLINSYEAYEDLLAKSQKGLEFYQKLETSASKLLQRAVNVCKVQEEERENLMEQNVKKNKVTASPAHRPMASPKPSPAHTATAEGSGPKLKDYLQYMNAASFGMSAGNISSVPSVPSHFEVRGDPNATSMIRPDEVYGSGIAQLPRSSAMAPDVNAAPSRPFRYPTEMRPTPLGSEQVDITPHPPNLSGATYGQAATPYAPSSSVSMPQHVSAQSIPAKPFVPSQNMAASTSYMAPSNVSSSPYIPPTTRTTASAGYYNAQSSANAIPQLQHNQMPASYQPASAREHYPAQHPDQTVDPSNAHARYIYGQSQSDMQSSLQFSGYPVSSSATSMYSMSTSGYANYGQNLSYMGSVSQEPTSLGQYPQQQMQPQQQMHPQPQYQEEISTAHQYSNMVSNYSSGNSVAHIQDQSITYPAATNPHASAYSPLMEQTRPNAHLQMMYQDTQQQQQVYSQHQALASIAPVAMPPMQPSYSSTQILTPSLPPVAPVPAATDVTKREPSSNLELLQQLDQTPIPTVPLQPFVATVVNHTKPISNGSTNDETVHEPSVTDIAPRVSIEDLMRQKELKVISEKASIKDVFADKDMLDRFVAEVERFEKQVDGLTKQSLKGSTPLDQKWKEIMDFQDRESRKLSISVARCCLNKNRVPDIMPYDNCRVEIHSLKDDYINASHILDLSKSAARYIATQSPLAVTSCDFWTMVYEQQSEIIVCLLSNAEFKGDIYFPTEKGQVLSHGPLTVHLQTTKQKPWGIERVIFISHQETRISRAILHLQFTEWSSSVVPSNPLLLLQCITDVHGYYREQRSSRHPIIVHCSVGVGRTGVFCLLSIAIQEVDIGNGLLDLWSTASKMTQMRKYIIQDKDHMKFCFQALLYYAQDILMRRGILTRRISFEDKANSNTHKSSHVRHPSEDFILGSGNLGKLQSGMAKMGIVPLPAKDDVKSYPGVNISKGSDLTQQPSVQVLDDQSSGPQTRILERSGSSLSVSSSTDADSYSTTGIPMTVHGSEAAYIGPNLLGLDAAHFTLDPMPRKAKRITKESFMNYGGQLSTGRDDPTDPLSQLDPLWSIHKRAE